RSGAAGTARPYLPGRAGPGSGGGGLRGAFGGRLRGGLGGGLGGGLAERGEQGAELRHRLRDHPVVDPGAAPVAADETGGAQHLQVVGDRGGGEVEGGGEVAD